MAGKEASQGSVQGGDWLTDPQAEEVKLGVLL